jgi:transcriptional regulator GlxA family with amidase domain
MIRWLNEVRLKRARSLLIHSRLPIKQVAALSGFRDEYYFSAVFRRFHRLAPSAYREKSEKTMGRDDIEGKISPGHRVGLAQR